MFYKSRLMTLLAVTLILLAGCGGDSLVTSPVPTPTPASGEVQLLRDIVADPGQYEGKEVMVEGVLEENGEMPRIRFFLRDGKDRLETSSWAPLETIQPPQGGAAAKSMVYYVDKRLRLTGTLEKGIEGLVLQVSRAEELP